MATIQYARLYPDTTQLQAKDGHNLTAGWVEVYLAGTDDPAITYADFNGTRNPQKIIVDDNGRFCAIVDKSKAYRVEVYDEDGMLQWATEPVWCTGNAGAGMSVTKVVSTDGSIAVEENVDGSERTYDISIAPSDSDEFLEWIKCSEEDCGSTWHPVYQAGTMETEAGQGIKVHAGQLYHFTNTFYVDPNGTGINYDTFKVIMYCNDEIVDVRDFDIDSSLNDSVMCEFSTDLIPEADGVVYYKLTIPGTCEVTAEVQCHRIYSGINAVPDTCATKQWVQEAFDYNMAEKISYSALEYNNNGDISGISGSAIAGGLDSAAVSAIASSYAESAISSISGWSGDFSSISSKIDWSSSGVFQPSGDYQTAGDYAYNSSLSSKVDQSAFEQCCDEVHSALDEKLDKSASSEFQPSGQYVYESAYSSFTIDVTNNISSLTAAVSGIAADMSSYVPFSGLEGEGGKVTGISGSAFKGHEYTGINPVTVDNTADTISVEHRTLCVDSTMTAYNSGSSAVIGVNVAGLDISSKMDASASSLFYPTSNPSGFLTAHQSLAGYATEAYVDSSVSSKLDTTAFSTVSGDFLTSHQSLAGYATESYVDSAVSGKLDVTATSQFLTSLPDDLAYTSDVASAVSGKMDKSESSSFYPMDSNPSGYLTAHQSLAGYATIEYVDSAVSGKLDATAYDSAEFYSTSNPSGFLTGVDLTPYQLTADMSAYAHESSLSAKLDASASSDFYGTANPSGFIDGASASAIASAYQVVSATATQLNAGTAYLTSVNETPISAARAGNAANASLANSAWYDGTGRMISALPDEATVSSIASAYAESAASGKLDESATADFYSTSNPSGFITGVDLSDYATTAYVDSSVSSKLDTTAFNSGDFYSTSNPSGFITGVDLSDYATTAYVDSSVSSFVDSAYVESQVSSKQDTLTFAYNEDSAISSINGSALAGQGGAQVVTSITTGGYGVREINGMVINASHMVLGAEAAYNTSNVVKLGNSDYGAGVFLTGSFGTAYYKVNELQLNRNGTGFIGFNIGGAGSQITATSNAGGKFSAGGTGGNRSYFTAFNASASASIEVTGSTAMINITDTGYTSTIYPSSVPYWNAKMDSAEMSAYVAKSAYDDLYSAFTALSGVISTYSGYFSSISAKVDNSAIGVIE